MVLLGDVFSVFCWFSLIWQHMRISRKRRIAAEDYFLKSFPNKDLEQKTSRHTRILKLKLIYRILDSFVREPSKTTYAQRIGVLSWIIVTSRPADVVDFPAFLNLRGGVC